ncbi:MAG: hypothetical protein AAFR22_14525, partial [Chloroflexota bacterium]
VKTVRHPAVWMIALMLLIGSVIQAQDATPQTGASISFDDGVVTEITAEGVVVNGLTILIAPGILDDDTDPIEVGTVLDVDGVLDGQCHCRGDYGAAGGAGDRAWHGRGRRHIAAQSTGD